jgi:hypothetical protein
MPPVEEVNGLQSRSERCGEQKPLLLPRIEHQLLGLVAYSLVTIPAEVARHLSNNMHFMNYI